jgi:hypothetical protein
MPSGFLKEAALFCACVRSALKVRTHANVKWLHALVHAIKALDIYLGSDSAG